MRIPKIHPHTGHYIPVGAVAKSGQSIARHTQQKTGYEQQEQYHQPKTEADWGGIIFLAIIAVIFLGYIISIITSVINKIRSVLSSIKKNHAMTDKELEKLMKLVVLRNNGALTDAEFERERRKITKDR